MSTLREDGIPYTMGLTHPILWPTLDLTSEVPFLRLALPIQLLIIKYEECLNLDFPIQKSVKTKTK